MTLYKHLTSITKKVIKTHLTMAAFNGPFEPERANVSYTSAGRIILTEGDVNEELNHYNTNTCVVFALLSEVEQDNLRGQMRALVGKAPAFRTKYTPGVIRNRVAVVTCRASPFSRRAAACQCSVESLGGLILDSFRANPDGQISCRQYLSFQARMLLASMLKGTEPLDEVKWITVGSLEKIPDEANFRDLNKHLATLVWRTTFSLTNLKRLEHRKWWSLFIKKSLSTWCLSHLEATVEYLESSNPDPDITIESRIRTAEQIEASRNKQCLATWGDVSEIQGPGEEDPNSRKIKPHLSRDQQAELKKKKTPQKPKKYKQPDKGYVGQEHTVIEDTETDESQSRSRMDKFNKTKNTSGILKKSFAASTPLVSDSRPGDSFSASRISRDRSTSGKRDHTGDGEDLGTGANVEKMGHRKSVPPMDEEHESKVKDRLRSLSQGREETRPKPSFADKVKKDTPPEQSEFVSPTHRPNLDKVTVRKRVSLVNQQKDVSPPKTETGKLYPGEDLKAMEEYRASQIKDVSDHSDSNDKGDSGPSDEEAFRTALEPNLSSTLIDGNGNEQGEDRSSTPLMDEFGLPVDRDQVEKVDLNSSKAEQTHRLVTALDPNATSASLPASLLTSDPAVAEQVLITTGKPLVDTSSTVRDMSASWSNRQQKKVNTVLNMKLRVSQIDQQVNQLTRQRVQCMRIMESDMTSLMVYDPTIYESVEKEKKMSRKKLDVEISRKQQEIKAMKRQRRLMTQQEMDGRPLDFEWMEPGNPSESEHDYESIPDEINRDSDHSAPPPKFSEINAAAESVIREKEEEEDEKTSRQMEIPDAPAAEETRTEAGGGNTPPDNLMDF